jgi:Ca-activated chloride channel family protein
VAAVLAAGVVPVAWQGPVPDGQTRARFSSGVQLVEVYVTVTTETGNHVGGLDREDFEIWEDGRTQRILVFAAGSFPVTVALGVDRSWSMAGRPLELAKKAAQGFLRQLTLRDRSTVVAIGSDAEVIAPVTLARHAQISAIAALEPWGTTSLHDATIAALDRLAAEPGRQAFVVFSDGVDRYSGATASDVIGRARRSHALVYPITVGRSRTPLMPELAVVTGGRSFWLKDIGELDRTLAAVARELRSQYLLGYTPARSFEPGNTEWRSIRVGLRTAGKGVRVRARDGYQTD